MNKKNFLLFCLLILLFLISKSQVQISKFNNNYTSVYTNSLEDNEGNYLVSGITNPNGISDIGYLMKISSSRIILNELQFQYGGENSFLTKMIHYNTNIIVIGKVYNEFGDNLFFLKLDSNLQINDCKFIPFQNNRHINYFNLLVDSDSSIIISGCSYAVSGNSYIQPFLYQINGNGDSIKTKYFNNSNIQVIYQLHESPDSSKYFAFMDGYRVGYEISGILHLDKNFDTIEYHCLSSEYNYIFSSISLYDSLFLVTNLDLTSTQYLKICLINQNGVIKNYLEFSKSSSTNEYPAYSPGISHRDGAIYIGATSGFDFSNPNYSTNDSWFHLIKMDENMNVIWEKWYGGDAYFFLRSVTATSDGGCLMVGTKYPHGIGNQFLQGHYVKVDSNGNVQWTQDIEIPELSYKVYPNPTQSVFNIENSEFKIQSIELYDISGRYLKSIQDCNNSTISIDLTPFSNGIYFAKIKSSKGVRTEKVVKN